MAEFCSECYRKLFNPRAHLLLSTNEWLCEGCGEWKPVVELEVDEEQFEEFIYSDEEIEVGDAIIL